MLWKKEAFIFRSPKLLGIYVHFPFCQYKCGYCDFYSEVGQDHHGYFSFLIKELELYFQNDLVNETYDTLYLGGGTPSLANLSELEIFLEFLDQKGLFKNLKEITIEANPESVSLEKWKKLKNLGINRISLGIQSLNPTLLKKIGRLASFEKTIEAILLTKEMFSNYSLDLIYGIQEQDLCEELFSLMTFHPPHLSTYMLSLEKKVPFYKKKTKFLECDDAVAEAYAEIRNFMLLSGYEHYEVSNFSLPQKQSQHNLHYWNGDSFLGLGAGASGYMNDCRTRNHEFQTYRQLLNQNKLPVKERDFLQGLDFFVEDILLKLRLTEPFSIQHHFNLLHKDQQSKIIRYFNHLNQNTYLQFDQDLLMLSANFKTWLYLDHIIQTVYNIF